MAEGRRSPGAEPGRGPPPAPDAASARGPALRLPRPRLRHQGGDNGAQTRHMVSGIRAVILNVIIIVILNIIHIVILNAECHHYKCHSQCHPNCHPECHPNWHPQWHLLLSS